MAVFEPPRGLYTKKFLKILFYLIIHYLYCLFILNKIFIENTCRLYLKQTLKIKV